jgi:hypothetical protein
MTVMALQIPRNFAPKTASRAEREYAWIRRHYALGGAKQLDADLRCGLDRARKLYSGQTRLNDREMDVLEALFGPDFTDVIAAPGLAQFAARKEAEARAAYDRFKHAQHRIARAFRSDQRDDLDGDSVVF